MQKKIWLSSPHMSDEGHELRYVQEAFASNWIAPLGENVDRFEEEFAALAGADGAAALSSGTAALHLALKACNIGQGDIVFCQDLTFVATANPILYEKAIPVFIDSDQSTWNMDPNALETAFKRFSNVKAVVVVHLYGLSADLDPIIELCHRYDVPLIEDAAESLGTTYKGKMTGTLGDYGVYSFNGNKIITTSGGGMLVSQHPDILPKIRFWATQARDPAPHYQHSEAGYNYRMSNVLAGIGRGQLKVLDQRVREKQHIFEFYRRTLGELPGIEFMPIREWNHSNCWLSCALLTGKVTPTAVVDALYMENIEARPLWKPMHLQPLFRGCDIIGGNVAETLFKQGVCLPSDTKLEEIELAHVAKIIHDTLLKVNS